MKYFRISSLLLFTLLFVMSGLTSCDKTDDEVLEEDPALTLTAAEEADLLFMREEEKLARDVYIYFYEKYDLNIFNNISSSEQTHMDFVLEMMEKYGVEDIASNEMGIFTNPDLQALYNDLIAQGDASLVAALRVGATIEDVDIRDLSNVIDATTKTDLIDVYQVLTCGSRNHMRAFVSQLKSRDETYSPQFINQDVYDAIIDGQHENCRP